jgi:spore germination protein GerM
MIKNKKNLKFFLFFLILILIGAGIYFSIQNRTKKNWVVYENKIYGFSLKIPSKKTKKVSLYYYNPEKDKDETGNIKCSRDGLMPIEREIPVSQTPIKDTIELLLKGKENLTEKELSEGITTEYPLEGLKLKSVNLKEDGTLILEFEDSLNKTVGGACRVGILWFQIEATAKQFPEVKKVQFLPEELFQP